MVAEQTVFTVCGKGLFLLQLFLQAGQLAVFQLSGTVKIVFVFCAGNIRVNLFNAFTELLNLGNCIALVVPARFHVVELVALFGKLAANFDKVFLRVFVIVAGKSGFFNLQTHYFPGNFVHFGRHGVHFRLDERTCLVNKVDSLVGKEPVGNITVGKRCGGDKCRVVNLDAVINLVTFLQTAKDGNRVLNGGFGNGHGLETALECSILFDVFAVFVKRCCADAVQLAACKHGLQNVARIHCAVGLAGADNGVKFVDEHDDPAFAALDFVKHSFQPFFKFTAIFCARNKGTHVQRKESAILQIVGDVAAHDKAGVVLCFS